MSRSLKVFTLACLVLSLGLAAAQDSAVDTTAVANSAYQAKDWTKAEFLYEQLSHA
jgi:hypothetical protein